MTYPPFYDDQSLIELKTFNTTYIPKNNCGGSCDLLQIFTFLKSGEYKINVKHRENNSIVYSIECVD